MVIHLHCDNNSHSLPRTRNRLCKRKAMMGECLSIVAYVQPHPASTNIVRNRVMWRHSFSKKIYNSFSLAARSIISRDFCRRRSLGEMWNTEAHGKIHGKMAARLLTSQMKETWKAALNQVFLERSAFQNCPKSNCFLFSPFFLCCGYT